MPVRTSQSLGPVYVERAETVGRNRLALGVSHLYADLDRFDGHDFADDIATASVAPGGKLGQGFQAQDFSLESHVTSLSATYGVTDAWDVNVLLPIVQTSLQIDGTSVAVAVVKSSGSAVLDSAATTAFKKWRFKPGVFRSVRIPVSWAVNRVK